VVPEGQHTTLKVAQGAFFISFLGSTMSMAALLKNSVARLARFAQHI
jgi:hypothetical protein